MIFMLKLVKGERTRSREAYFAAVEGWKSCVIYDDLLIINRLAKQPIRGRDIEYQNNVTESQRLMLS
jgi:hypothetical protein